MNYFLEKPHPLEALDILNKKNEWKPILDQLVRRFDDTPNDIQSNLKDQLEEALIDMASMMGRMPDAPLSRLIARRLSALDCFYGRATKKGNDGSVYWNPLAESFSDFRSEDMHFYEANEIYPPSDIIRKWSQENLM